MEGIAGNSKHHTKSIDMLFEQNPRYLIVKASGICVCIYILYIYRVSQEECAILREGVPYGKVYRYNPKHLCPKLNGYGDNGHRKVWSSVGSMHYSYQLTNVISICP
jgi:hypothetical protein